MSHVRLSKTQLLLITPDWADTISSSEPEFYMSISMWCTFAKGRIAILYPSGDTRSRQHRF